MLLWCLWRDDKLQIAHIKAVASSEWQLLQISRQVVSISRISCYSVCLHADFVLTVGPGGHPCKSNKRTISRWKFWHEYTETSIWICYAVLAYSSSSTVVLPPDLSSAINCFFFTNYESTDMSEDEPFLVHSICCRYSVWCQNCWMGKTIFKIHDILIFLVAWNNIEQLQQSGSYIRMS